MKKLLFIFSAFIIVSCTSVPFGKGKVGTGQTSITNSKWILAETVKGKTPTLIVESGKISGNAGCNNYFSNDVIMDPTAGNFSIKNIATTKMACENMNIENNFLDVLQKVNKYVYSGTTLELYKDNLLLLRFNKL